ncbi:DEAD/DEAH box helicase [Metabacillus fastidiosus]|uniref:DEAD/DEAH box helicase n=1 Tax=Metabacillus fastidiosus TaxID=1458 RepID=UPI000826D367|nr:DEAD/DEAH box helicase [Metabacillus fastidiosus]MED4463425.1 DEAD/DEAH box helicase [Metabacillus fastidiosus]
MNYFLNQRKIKQICGETAYKKGKKYFQEKRVYLKDYDPNSFIFEAAVKVDGIFNVLIEREGNGFIYAECTCPKLASFHKHCQHIAAVLVCLHDIQVNGIPAGSKPIQHSDSADGKISPSTKNLTQTATAQLVDGTNEKKQLLPLKAKLFLDRVKNRLLAGLEFHYGNIVINPLEYNRENSSISSLIIRNAVREHEIMHIMEESFFTKTESGYFLHDEEAEYDFLHRIVPNMKELVDIYATTAVKNRLYKIESRPNIKIEVDERTDWLIFEFHMEGIPESEIRDLLMSLVEKRKYYRIKDGRLLTLEDQNFKEINQLLSNMSIEKEQLNDKETRIPFLQGLRNIAFLPHDSIHIGKAFSDLLNCLQNPDQEEAAISEKLNAILHDYQKHGVYWLRTLADYKFGGILADDMGLGKTLQSIAYIVSVLSEIREQKKPVLVLAPSSLIYNWLNELNKFAKEVHSVIIDGSQAERNAALMDMNKADVIITSYPLLRRDINKYVRQSFHTLFLDEAQAVKNHTTQTAKMVKRVRADYRFALTGTPVENSVDDLWSIFNIVFPNLMPERKELKDMPRETIAKLVRPFILRRMKEDVLNDLPGKNELIYISELLPDQKRLYAAYLAKLKYETLKHLNKDSFQKNRLKILAGLTRLRQLCCHPALFVDNYNGDSAKLLQLMEIVRDYRSKGRRILIFSQFTKMLEIIGGELTSKGIKYFYLNGNTPAMERVELCNRFNKGDMDLFLISLKAGGTGLNLSGADTVILYDLWWNPAVEQQAADRAHRMGQKNEVKVIKLISKGTIEEKINELQENKKNLINEIIQPSQNNTGILTEQEIRNILMI